MHAEEYRHLAVAWMTVAVNLISHMLCVFDSRNIVRGSFPRFAIDVHPGWQIYIEEVEATHNAQHVFDKYLIASTSQSKE